jgi:hypothetical protein
MDLLVRLFLRLGCLFPTLPAQPELKPIRVPARRPGIRR